MRKVGTKLFLAMLLIVFLMATALAGEVNLSIAASLKDVINELSDNFARQNADIKFLKNYGGSGALAKQIENGAPADIFISANIEWMEYLQSRKLMHARQASGFLPTILLFLLAGRTRRYRACRISTSWRRSPSAARRVFLPENTPWKP